jgi:hypothetical protein
VQAAEEHNVVVGPKDMSEALAVMHLEFWKFLREIIKLLLEKAEAVIALELLLVEDLLHKLFLAQVTIDILHAEADFLEFLQVTEQFIVLDIERITRLTELLEYKPVQF